MDNLSEIAAISTISSMPKEKMIDTFGLKPDHQGSYLDSFIDRTAETKGLSVERTRDCILGDPELFVMMVILAGEES